jgi:hypothetical protein
MQGSGNQCLLPEFDSVLFRSREGKVALIVGEIWMLSEIILECITSRIPGWKTGLLPAEVPRQSGVGHRQSS